jgi:hypothetical protein
MSWTTGAIPYESSSQLAFSSNFAFNGTNLTLGTGNGIVFGGDTQLSRGAANRLDLASGDSLNLVSGNLQVGGTTVVTSGRLLQVADGSSGAPSFSFSAATGTGIYRDAAGALAFTQGNTPVGYMTFNNIALGNQVAQLNTGNDNTFLGTLAGYINTGDSNNFFGYYTGYNNTGSNNNFFGSYAGYNNTGSYSEFIGFETGGRMSASNTIAIGRESLRGGSGSVFSGNAATTTNNTALGAFAGYNVATGGDNNLLLGYRAGYNLTTGANNIAIGYDIDLPSNTASNQLNIGNLIFGTGIDGTGTTLSSGNIGIGTSTPSSKLDVWGDFRVGTSSTPTLFVDTVTGNVGIGTSTPTAALTVVDTNTMTATNDVFSIYRRSGVNTSNVLRINATGQVTFGEEMEQFGFSGNVYDFGLAGSSAILSSDIFFNIDVPAAFDSSRILNVAENGTSYFTVYNDGNIGIGTSTPTSLLSLDNTGISGGGVMGLSGYFESTNSTLDAVQLGGRQDIVMNNTATSTMVGNFITVTDGTTLGNTVRGLEVQADRGGNTQGENTALSGFARTFGVRAFTSADAGGSFEPAAGFFELGGSGTQGNAIRAYSDTITTSDLLSLFQASSSFAGTGLLMNFGNAGGDFASTSSKFVDFQNAGTSKFTVSAHGTTTIGDGTTNYMASLQIGFGGLCVDNDGSCVATTTGRISSVSSYQGNSDLAEMYFSSQVLEPGELVVSDSFISIERAQAGDTRRVLGVVSTKPGLLIGADDTSLIPGQQGYPLALSGRVPVLLSDENGPIAVGDPLTLSSIPGVAMKATGSVEVVGYALEAFDGTRAYTAGYINQFGDDIAAPSNAARNVNDDERINDGCTFGGGGRIGADDEACEPQVAAETEAAELDTSAYDAEQAALDTLRNQPAELRSTDAGETVRVGRVTMFVERGTYFAPEQLAILNELTSTSRALVLGAEGGSDETLWDRLKVLAQNFVDGILTLTGVKADRVETSELCVDDVCVTADDLRALLEGGASSAGEAAVDAGSTPDSEVSTTGTSTADDTNSTVTESANETATTDTVPATDQGANTTEVDGVSTTTVTASATASSSDSVATSTTGGGEEVASATATEPVAQMETAADEAPESNVENDVAEEEITSEPESLTHDPINESLDIPDTSPEEQSADSVGIELVPDLVSTSVSNTI